MNTSSYPKGKRPVKAHYTIRRDGRIYHVCMSHLEVLRFLRLIWNPRREA